MFDSLEEKIRRDDAAEKSRGERVVEGVAIALISMLLFGGLYFAIRMLN
jgi:hypothetical protein